MGELTGGLIQMNSHVQMSCVSVLAVSVGALGLVLFLWLAFLVKRDKDRGWWICAAVAAMFLAMAVWGFGLPKVKIVKACAQGQVSLEQVAAVYDILDVDGKELTLRVR